MEVVLLPLYYFFKKMDRRVHDGCSLQAGVSDGTDANGALPPED